MEVGMSNLLFYLVTGIIGFCFSLASIRSERKWYWFALIALAIPVSWSMLGLIALTAGYGIQNFSASDLLRYFDAKNFTGGLVFRPTMAAVGMVSVCFFFFVFSALLTLIRVVRSKGADRGSNEQDED
jgi:hypothetical protein